MSRQIVISPAPKWSTAFSQITDRNCSTTCRRVATLDDSYERYTISEWLFLTTPQKDTDGNCSNHCRCGGLTASGMLDVLEPECVRVWAAADGSLLPVLAAAQSYIPKFIQYLS